MVETSNHAIISMYSQLNNGMWYRRNEINRTENYFIVEVRKRETISKTLSKYNATFDSLDRLSCFYQHQVVGILSPHVLLLLVHQLK